MIDPAQRQFIVTERSAEDKTEVFFQSTVIDVDGAGSIAHSAVIFRSFQMEKECTQVRNVCVVQGEAVCFHQPAAAFKDTPQVTVNGALAVVDQLQEFSDSLQFIFIKWRFSVLHDLSFRYFFRSALCNGVRKNMKEEHEHT
jgi:hypothetical protein